MFLLQSSGLILVFPAGGKRARFQLILIRCKRHHVAAINPLKSCLGKGRLLMGNDRIKNEENYEGRERKEQQSPGRNPQDEQKARPKEELESDPQRGYEKDPKHRERGAGSVL